MKIYVATIISIALLLGNSVNFGDSTPQVRRVDRSSRLARFETRDLRVLVGLLARETSVNQRVAFTAVRTTNTDVSTSNDTPLPFEKTETLLPGTSFDLKTGTFTCSVPGTYVFMFSALKFHPSSDLFVFLRKNGDIVVTSISTDSIHNEQVSGSAVLALQQGDTVYLTLYGKAFSGSWQQTTFSGFLLYPE
ncbi:caprin-2-like [Patiria miniata]|uniref:C1q domain-containing protein n=1 Tax=Patiria miniata TaxID=46514 RepID=A0A913YXC9_PATMI|nr:caprin-2-like [Patiria miniata]